MRILIAGSTGMIGSLVLNKCLKSDKVTEVISLVREKSIVNSSKLKEVIISDFQDYSKKINLFKKIDVAFFCIGAYTGQVSDEQLKKITIDYAYEFAAALKKESPKARLCLLSGAGADRTEKSRTSFARYKGMAENKILALNLDFYTFRPGYIYSVTPRKEPNFMYVLLRFFYPVIWLFGKRFSIKSNELARSMFNVGISGSKNKIIENKDTVNYL